MIIIKKEKIIRVKGTSKRKAHKRRITFEGKEKESIVKSSLDPDNLVEIKSFEDSGINVVAGMHESETYICKFNDESRSIHKTMKKGDIIGEVGTYETSKILGWDIVPETIQCDYGKGEGSSQKWIPDGLEPDPVFGGDYLKREHLNDLSKIFILDMVIGNFDRHNGNIIIKGDRVFAIDNEMWGKRNNAELHIEGLEAFAKDGAGSFMPMFGVLADSFGDDVEIYKEFKELVDENIDVALLYKSEILKYWNKQISDDVFAGGVVQSKEAVGYIDRSIKYLENYRGKK